MKRFDCPESSDHRSISKRLMKSRKSDPPTARFDVMSGLDEYLEEEREPRSACPPTLKTGETPREAW